jgi:hypothetical protein
MLRPVLGRSDSYHLLFVLPMSVMLFSYLLEETLISRKEIQYLILTVIIVFFLRESTQLAFLQPQIIKLQTYGNAEGQYPSYRSARTGILTNIDVDTAQYDNMLDYIKNNTSRGDKIFTYPVLPEIYFLTDRSNATRIDTPLAFFTTDYQKLMINELKENNVKMIVYNPKENLSNLNAGSLPLLKDYLENHFTIKKTFGDYRILTTSDSQ